MMPFILILCFALALFLAFYVKTFDEEDPSGLCAPIPQEAVSSSAPSSPGGMDSPQEVGRIPLRFRRRKPDEDLAVNDLLIQNQSLGEGPFALDLWDIVPEDLLHIHAFYPDQPPLVITTTPHHDNIPEEKEALEESPQPQITWVMPHIPQEPLTESSEDGLLLETQDTSTPTHAQPVLHDQGVGTDIPEPHDAFTQTQPLIEDKSLGTEPPQQKEISTQTHVITHDQGTSFEKPRLKKVFLPSLPIAPTKSFQDQSIGEDKPLNPQTLKTFVLEPLHVGPFKDSLDFSDLLKNHAPQSHKKFDVNDVKSVISEYVSVSSSSLNESRKASFAESLILEDMPKVPPFKPLLNPYETPTPIDKDQPAPQPLIMSFHSWKDDALEDQEDSWQKVLGSPKLKAHSLMSLSFEKMENPEPSKEALKPLSSHHSLGSLSFEILEKEEDKPLPPPPLLNFKKKSMDDLSFEKIE